MAELRGEDARHLARVLRAEAGQRYEISDGKVAYLAEIAEARGPRVVFRIIEPLDTPATPLHITLCAALIKFDRFEWIVEKATELGVERILPVEAERSGKGLLEASAQAIRTMGPHRARKQPAGAPRARSGDSAGGPLRAMPG